MTYRIAAVVVAAALSLLLTSAAASAGDERTPPVGRSAKAVDLSKVRGATDFRGGTAIPLAGRTPGWYTSVLAAEVDLANGRPVAAPNDAPLPSEVGIRPGAWMVAPSGCTMNFIFRRSGEYAIGTAGHCVRRTGQEVVLLTLAPGSGNPVLVEVGQVLKRRSGGVGDDFALVSIRPRLERYVSPTTALIGGPCGQYGGDGPETVAHYGHGIAIGTGGTPRVGLALTWRRYHFGWDGAGIFGDSGSPVRVTDLRAAGNFTHIVVDDRFLPSILVGTRIQKMLDIAGGWRLANSPLCP